MNLNKVQLIGRVGRDAELRLTPEGYEVATVRVATNRTWKDAQGNVTEAVEWHSVVTWRQLASQVARLAKKGRLVYVEGRLETRKWDDKNTGVTMYRTEIIGETVRMLDAKPEEDDAAVLSDDGIVGPEGGRWKSQANTKARSGEAVDPADPHAVVTPDGVLTKTLKPLPFVTASTIVPRNPGEPKTVRQGAPPRPPMNDDQWLDLDDSPF